MKIYEPHRRRYLTPDEVVCVLRDAPLTADRVRYLLETFTVELEFVHFESPNARSLPLPDSAGDFTGWLILIHQPWSEEYVREGIWHELVHLHLCAYYGVKLNENSDDEIHDFIILEGIRLARTEPIPLRELLRLLTRHA